MAVNTLNTRIQLKYDTLAHWVTSTFKPLKGEVCIAEIPSTQEGSAGMTPPAIGIKIGDGTKTFNQLAWIQAVAGDVYSWAKAAEKPTYTADEISGLSNYISGQIQDTDTVYQIVEGTNQDVNKFFLQAKAKSAADSAFTTISTIDLSDIYADVDQLKTDLDNLDVGDQIDTKIAALDVNNITGFGAGKTLATLTEVDGKIAATFQDIAITKNQVTDAGTAIGATVATSPITDNDTGAELTTKAQVATYVAGKVAGLTGAMHFIGISTSTITDGGTENPTINGNPVSTKAQGDVVLYNNGTNISQEYVWTGTAWELLGDEGSYAVKGSITKSDLDSSLSSEIDGKLNITDAQSTYVAKNGTDRLITETEANKLAGIEANADVNIIEKIQVPGNTSGSFTDLTITNDKAVRLAKIAETGNVNNLLQDAGDFLILNCGDASHFIADPT